MLYKYLYMWTYEKKNRTRETLSKIVFASITGATAGLSIGLLEKVFMRRSNIRVRTADLFVLGGTYALVEAAVISLRPKSVYSPIISGCAAGLISSSSTRSVITTSIIASTFGYIFENRRLLFKNT